MFRSLSAFALLCALASPAAAQTASVSGTITDQSGAAVPGARRHPHRPGGPVDDVRIARRYSFPNLANGTYRVTATLSGFAPSTRDVDVSGSNVEVPAMNLALAGLSDTIVVSATKSDSALIDAPATISVSPAKCWRERASRTTAICCARCRRQRPSSFPRRRQRHEPPGHVALSNSKLVLLDDRSST